MNAEDQLEILHVLQAASSDPSFPILIAGRPERVFREFFGAENNPAALAKKLDLREDTTPTPISPSSSRPSSIDLLADTTSLLRGYLQMLSKYWSIKHQGNSFTPPRSFGFLIRTIASLQRLYSRLFWGWK
jgi:hypothetical protein